MASYNSINFFDLLPNTIWTDIYKKKSRYNNVEELYNLNSETRDSLLYMIKFGHLKLFYGIVYSSGIGTFGRLGDGRTDLHFEGTPIPIDTANIGEKRVIQVSVGECHSLFLCEDGSVYASGIGMWGTPIPIDTSNMNGKRVIQVSAGDSHSLFLCEDGSVYAFGSGKAGQLGDGRTDKHNEFTPIPIDNSNMEGKRVIQVSAGYGHSLFLCEDGSVYASGNGQYGRLGDGITDPHYEGTPILIDKSNIQVKRVIQVDAGVSHSLFLCEDGSVYASGFGRGGQLGDGRTDDHYEGTPIPIDKSNMEGKRETGLTCQRKSTSFAKKLAFSNETDGFVRNRQSLSRTGLWSSCVRKSSAFANETFGFVPVSQKVIQVSASEWHSLFLCEDGSVYASGDGQYGQLGDGRIDYHNEGTPIPIDTSNMEGKRVIQVSAGLDYSLFLCEDGSVYASGSGFDGRLGDGRTDYHYEGIPIPIDTANMDGKRVTELTCQSVSQRVTELTCQSVSQRVIQVSAGKDHSLFLT